MRCLVCGAVLTGKKRWEHLQSVHLEPLGVTPEKILAYARETARPLEVKPASLTCLKPAERIIYFSVDNAELLIAFAHAHGSLPWREVVEWQILHEKAHLDCRELYEIPRGKAYILSNAEDYFINRYLLPEKYWPVCLMNARCATAIRNLAPLPYTLRDGYYYCTLATFLAYGAVTLADIHFLKPAEAKFVGLLAALFGKIKEARDVSPVGAEIYQAFIRLYPPPGTPWDDWQIPDSVPKRNT